MRESESFDAFYARSVTNVTSQMHELANGDPQADHAIREAYARAYQQWFEVSGYRDTEKWVLDVAKDAFERRRSEAGSMSPAPPPDTGTWPGMYRPRTPQPAGDPSAAAYGTPSEARAWPAGTAPGPTGPAAPGPAEAGWFRRGAGQASPVGQNPYRSVAPADGEASAFDQAFLAASAAQAAPVQSRPAADGAQQPSQFVAGQRAASALPGGGAIQAGDVGQGQAATQVAAPNGGRKLYSGLATTTQNVVARLGQRGISRNAVAVTLAIIVVAVAVVAYVALGHKAPVASSPGGHGAKPGAKAQPHMLSAGRTGPLAAIPWSLVGSGWTLAQFSQGQPGSASDAASAATSYLVDPKGGKYVIHQWTAGTAAALVAWSGDAKRALFHTGSGYAILDVGTGRFTPLSLPANVTAFGFTRPDGKAVLAVQQTQNRYKLERYDVSGGLQAAFATMPLRSAKQAWPDGCTGACAALSSPDGDFDVWAVSGGGMEVLSNAGGHATRLHAPGSGHPAACVPISWWTSSTILADCAAQGSGAAQLWQLPANGGHPTQLTSQPGAASGDGVLTGAWQAGGKVYVTSTHPAQCSSGATAAGALEILGTGSSTAITVAGSTGDNAIIGSMDGKLLVLAQTSCPGSSSLLWLDPASGATTPLLTAPSSEAGVIAAVPYGSGTATAGN